MDSLPLLLSAFGGFFYYRKWVFENCRFFALALGLLEIAGFFAALRTEVAPKKWTHS